MLKISKRTKQTPERIVDRASRFFGAGGEGLVETGRNPCCISFEGGGGSVWVTVEVTEDGKGEVTVETREFERQAERFLEKL